MYKKLYVLQNHSFSFYCQDDGLKPVLTKLLSRWLYLKDLGVNLEPMSLPSYDSMITGLTPLISIVLFCTGLLDVTTEANSPTPTGHIHFLYI